jgi:hypothetical protein
MSVYSVENHKQPIGFVGSLTTYQACKQVGGCSGTGWGIDNTPQQGWTQLYRLLNSNPRTAQGLRWASDMKWTSATISSAAAAMKTGEGQEATEAVPASERNQVSIQTLEDSLQVEDLSDTMRLGLEDKLQAAQWAEVMRARGAQNPGPKNGPAAELMVSTPEPVTMVDEGEQIIEGSEGLVQPSIATIQNLWQGTIEGTSQQAVALAGAQAYASEQGVIILVVSEPDEIGFEPEMYLAPAGAGSLRIIERRGLDLILQTAAGQTLTFNLKDHSFR